jgi:hypothetical protein
LQLGKLPFQCLRYGTLDDFLEFLTHSQRTIFILATRALPFRPKGHCPDCRL